MLGTSSGWVGRSEAARSERSISVRAVSDFDINLGFGDFWLKF